MPDNNFYQTHSENEDRELDGRLSVIQLSNGDVSLAVEEWDIGDPASETEISEAVFIFTSERWTAFAKWVAGTVR